VKALAGEMPVEGRIVFTRRAKFPKGLPKWTLMVDSLGSEFPAGERALMSSVTERYAGDWKNVRTSVTPSSMATARQIAAG